MRKVIRMKLRELNDEIKRIKAEYEPDRKQAWEHHKLVSGALRAELEPLEAELERRKREIVERNLPESDEFRYMRRKDYKVDLERLGDEYFMRVPDFDKIEAELKASEWTKPIEGVEVFVKKSVVIK